MLASLRKKILSVFMGDYFLYMDISKYQETVDFPKAKATGIEGVLMRSSVGLQEDVEFSKHWKNSKGVMPRGAYHYYLDNKDAKAQAQKMFAVVSAAGDLGEERPTLDIEEINNPILSPLKIKTCLEEIEKLFGKKPYVYSSAYVLNKWIGNASWIKPYPLWISNPPFKGWFPGLIAYVASYCKPLMPVSHTAWDVWQFTFVAPAITFGVSGNNLDLDFRKGTIPVVPPPIPPLGETLMHRAKCIQTKINARPQPNKAQDCGDLYKDQTITWFPEKKWVSADGSQEWWPGITDHLVNGFPLVAYFAYKHPDFGEGRGLVDLGPLNNSPLVSDKET